FLIARSLGEPSRSRSSLSVVTTCLNMRPPSSPASTDETVVEVRGARRARPLRRRAVAAAARRLDVEHVPRPHDDADFLGLEDSRRAPAREETIAVREPVPAAEQAVGSMPHTVAGGYGQTIVPCRAITFTGRKVPEFFGVRGSIR